MQEPFNPLDPFDAATEALRVQIAAAIAYHWMESPPAQMLDPEAKFQSACTALTVSLAATLKAMTSLSDKAAIKLIHGSLPAAFKTAAGIMDNAENSEVVH